MTKARSLQQAEQEVKSSHINAALDAGADLASAEKSADELVRMARAMVKTDKAQPSPAETAYRDEISRWYADSKVCESDLDSQIAWLKKNPDPETFHTIGEAINIDDDLELARWIFSQSRTSKSSACFQVIAFVTSGSVGYRSEAEPLVRTMAKRIREGFYKGTAGLKFRKIYESERADYDRGLEWLSDKSVWDLPSDAFGPFPVREGQESRYVYEEGELRLSLNEWKRIQG